MKIKISIAIVACALFATGVYISGVYPLWLLVPFLFSAALVPVLGILFFVRVEVVSFWLKFFVIWLILSVLKISITSDYNDSGGFGVAFVVDQKMVALLMAGSFLIISLILIAWKSWRLRGK